MEAKKTQEIAKTRVFGRPFEKGNPGRPPGVQNKLSKTVRETVLSVFNELQDDPEANLIDWAKKETTEFYRIAAKLIPMEITAVVNETLEVTLKLK